MKRASRGFTLVEALVASAIVAVAGTLAYGGMRGVVRGGEQLEPAYRDLAALRTCFTILDSDIGQLAARGVRDEQGDPEAAVIGGDPRALLALTRRAPAGVPGALPVGLRRVAYRFEDGRLWRRVFATLDRVPGETGIEQTLIGGLQRVDVRFFDAEWRDFWPPRRGATGPDPMPRAIEVRLEFDTGHSARRVFLAGSRT